MDAAAMEPTSAPAEVATRQRKRCLPRLCRALWESVFSLSDDHQGDLIVDWKLELVLVPVSDVDRAKTFYTENVGFTMDVDHSAGEDFRIVQLTPPGSACSIVLMRNTGTAGAAQGLHLVVPDIDAARAELVARGTATSEIFHFEAGGQTPGPDPQRGDYNSFLSFNDPDGNGWLVQEVRGAQPT
jgi:catechol 2,3-dioxygenase-like lactoylglutathione lyase family enzyme